MLHPWVYFVIVWQVMSAFVDSAAADDVSRLRVMSYNVRYASDQAPNAWADRLPVAINMLERYQPDLIGMQEALYRQVKDFAAALPAFEWIGLGRDGGSRGEFMAVFYRKDRLEPLEFDHFWLSDTPDVVGSSTWGNSNRRMVTWIRFLLRANRSEFYLANTHFDHEVQTAREKSAKLLWQRMATFKPLPVILVGDFNAVAGANPAYTTLVGSDRLHDAWDTARERIGGELNTFHGYRPPREDGRRIDWILTRGKIAVSRHETVDYREGKQYPSDHFPILAEIEFAAEGESPN